MTTDDKTLTEQIARALAEVDGYGTADMHVDWVMRYYGDSAAAVLPIIRKAQADAWDEACEAFAWCIANGPIEDALPYVTEHNPHTTETEKEQTNG